MTQSFDRLMLMQLKENFKAFASTPIMSMSAII
uniref:Uncharacterized protein n=1 Tax=Rhizophora mucronata TaxID=61149 RepID=A0A2P2PAX4_RHIMU